jgi:hypothetical protein
VWSNTITLWDRLGEAPSLPAGTFQPARQILRPTARRGQSRSGKKANPVGQMPIGRRGSETHASRRGMTWRHDPILRHAGGGFNPRRAKMRRGPAIAVGAPPPSLKPRAPGHADADGLDRQAACRMGRSEKRHGPPGGRLADRGAEPCATKDQRSIAYREPVRAPSRGRETTRAAGMSRRPGRESCRGRSVERSAGHDSQAGIFRSFTRLILNGSTA